MSRLVTAAVVATGSVLIAALGSTLATAGGLGNETLNYTYDAKGRLTEVHHSGSVNTNVVANYSYDKADNRENVNVSGAP